MAHENWDYEIGDETHFWVDCPGCGYGGRIGLPLDYPAEAVVCPRCREIVRVKPQDRVLWRPADPVDFLRRRFPAIAWDSIERETSRTIADTNPKRQRGGADASGRRGPRRQHRGCRLGGLHETPRSRFGFGCGRISSRVLDNHFIQAALMLAGFVVPLATTLFLTQRDWQGEQLAAATASVAPERNGAGPKSTAREPPRTAPTPPDANGASQTSAQPEAGPAARSPRAAPVPNAPAPDEQPPEERAPAKRPPATPESAPDEKPPPHAAPNPERSAPRPSASYDVLLLVLYDGAAERVQAGDERGATPIFKQIVAMEAPNAECLMCRGMARAYLGDFAAAFGDATQAIQLAPRDARTWHTRAKISAHARRLQAALNDSLVAARLATPGRYEFEFVNEVTEYAESLAKQVNQSSARPASRAASRNAAASGSQSPASRHYQLGIEQFKQGTYGEAVVEFTEAIRLKPNSAASYHWRACALIELRRFDAALADMNRSLSLRGSYPVAFHARAVVFEHLGRYREAYADIVEALRLSPGNPIYLEYLARLREKVDARGRSFDVAHATASSSPGW